MAEAMNILLTGGHGFLGTHLRTIFDQNNTKYWAPLSKDFDLLDNLQYAIQNLSPWNFTHIIHLASKSGGILANLNNPAVFLRDNTQMALNIYELARLKNIKFVYSVGSVCAYPKFCPIPFKEDDIWNGLPEETNKFYSQSKRTLMMLCESYRTQFGIGGAHLIPINLFGPGDNFDLITSHAIPALIRKFDTAKTNNDPFVKVWGSGGDVSREFFYGPDCAEAIAKAVMMNLDTPLPINIGTGRETKITDLVERIRQMVGYNGGVRYNGKLDGQPRRCLDLTRCKELLGFQAKTSLEDGLAKTIQWYQEHKVEILAREEKK